MRLTNIMFLYAYINTIDADKLAHEVYEPGSKALEEIRNKFGKDILDDTDNTQIDRKKLGAIVFNDAASMSVSDLLRYRYDTIYNKTLPIVILTCIMCYHMLRISAQKIETGTDCLASC